MLSLERDVNTLAGRTGLLAGGQPLLSPTCGSYVWALEAPVEAREHNSCDLYGPVCNFKGAS